MANIRLPLWMFAVIGFSGVFFLANYVQAQFEEVTAIEDTSSYEIGSSVPVKLSVAKSEQLLIDKWIADNNLNSYGDSKDKVYASGGPLIENGKKVYKDKYQYILSNYPNKPWGVSKTEQAQ